MKDLNNNNMVQIYNTTVLTAGENNCRFVSTCPIFGFHFDSIC